MAYSPEEVAAAVVQSLQAISPTDGYHTAPPLPQVHVSGEPTSEPSDCVAFSVDFKAIGSGRADSVRRALDFVEDIRRRLTVEDPTLGGQVLSLTFIEGDEADGALTRNDGSARVNFEAQAKPAEADEKEQA